MRNPNARIPDFNDFVSDSGDTYHVSYNPRVNPDGTISLVESGKTDIAETINSFKESTDISFIISQLNAGNTSVLNMSTPHFGDFTTAPKTFAESLQLVIDAGKAFERLPLDVRNKFDNDVNQFLATAGTDEWIKKVGVIDGKAELIPGKEIFDKTDTVFSDGLNKSDLKKDVIE